MKNLPLQSSFSHRTERQEISDWFEVRTRPATSSLPLYKPYQYGNKARQVYVYGNCGFNYGVSPYLYSPCPRGEEGGGGGWTPPPLLFNCPDRPNGVIPSPFSMSFRGRVEIVRPFSCPQDHSLAPSGMSRGEGTKVCLLWRITASSHHCYVLRDSTLLPKQNSSTPTRANVTTITKTVQVFKINQNNSTINGNNGWSTGDLPYSGQFEYDSRDGRLDCLLLSHSHHSSILDVIGEGRSTTRETEVEHLCCD